MTGILPDDLFPSVLSPLATAVDAVEESQNSTVQNIITALWLRGETRLAVVAVFIVG